MLMISDYNKNANKNHGTFFHFSHYIVLDCIKQFCNLLNRVPAHRVLPLLRLPPLDDAEALPLLAEVGQVVRVQLVGGHILARQVRYSTCLMQRSDKETTKCSTAAISYTDLQGKARARLDESQVYVCKSFS